MKSMTKQKIVTLLKEVLNLLEEESVIDSKEIKNDKGRTQIDGVPSFGMQNFSRTPVDSQEKDDTKGYAFRNQQDKKEKEKENDDPYNDDSAAMEARRKEEIAQVSKSVEESLSSIFPRSNFRS